MQWLLGITEKVNQEPQRFLPPPSIQTLIGQTLRVVGDGRQQSPFRSADIRKVGGTCSWREILDWVDVMETPRPVVGMSMLYTVRPGGDGGEVKVARVHDLRKCIERFGAQEILRDRGNELMA